jgi:hypothetical protein
MLVRDKEAYIVVLGELVHSFSRQKLTLTGFLRRMIKLSARCIRKRANLWHSSTSRSSIFLTRTLIRTELTDLSTSTPSFSDLDTFSAGNTACSQLLDGKLGL